MKEREVLIDIHSIHAYDQEDTDSLDFTTDGLYRYEDGVGLLRYWESEVTGMPGTQTRVEISPESVVVDRIGMVNSRMEFREGLKSLFPYETPYGQATLGMDTRHICSRFNEHGGDMELDYVLNLEHMVAVRNKFRIRVTVPNSEDRHS